MWYRDRATLRYIALRFAPWFFGLSLAWEIGHARFYTVWTDGSAAWLGFSLLHCTFGDALIGVGSLVLVLAVLRAGPLHAWPMARVAGFTTAFGTGYTVFSEWMNVTLLRSWTYADTMPTIALGGFEMGVTPLLQWLLLPALALVLSRRAASSLSHNERTLR
jgi:hypothetical protein